MAARNKHCEKFDLSQIRTCSLWIFNWAVDRKSKGQTPQVWINFLQCLFIAAVVLTALCDCCSSSTLAR